MDSLLFQLFTIRYNKSLRNYHEYHRDLLDMIFIITKVIDNGLNAHLILNGDIVEKIILNNQEFSLSNTFKSNIFEREYLLIDDNLKNYMIEVTRILKLNDEDYSYIYLLLICTNYTEMKTLDSRITNAIDAIYSTFDLSYDDIDHLDDFMFHYIIKKLMKCDGIDNDKRCQKSVKLFHQTCKIHTVDTPSRFDLIFLQLCWDNTP